MLKEYVCKRIASNCYGEFTQAVYGYAGNLKENPLEDVNAFCTALFDTLSAANFFRDEYHEKPSTVAKQFCNLLCIDYRLAEVVYGMSFDKLDQ